MRTAVFGTLATLTLLTLATDAAAQQTGGAAPQGAPQPQSAPRGRLYVDGIVASVSDSAILQSRLFKATEGDIPEREAELGRQLRLDEVQMLSHRNLATTIDNYQMAQAARSFGNIPPERFDLILETQIEKEKEELRRSLGSYAAISDEFNQRGESWLTYQQDLRIEKLQTLAESIAIYERIRKQKNLHLTPRMLREAYRATRDTIFVRPAWARVAMVTFSGPDAQQHAQEAAEFWRTGDFGASEVAGRFPDAVAAPQLLHSSAPGLAEQMRAFAVAGPLGNVSDPIQRSGNYVVLYVHEHHEARNGQFSDREVQAELRQMVLERITLEFRAHALERARERTEVWIYEGGERREYGRR